MGKSRTPFSTTDETHQKLTYFILNFYMRNFIEKTKKLKNRKIVLPRGKIMIFKKRIINGVFLKKIQKRKK